MQNGVVHAEPSPYQNVGSHHLSQRRMSAWRTWTISESDLKRWNSGRKRWRCIPTRLNGGCAGGVVMLALLSLALPSGKAADTQPGTMAERMATLEHKLSAMAFDAAANEIVINRANLRIVNGLGTTDTTNELGNLIVGYNEPRNRPSSPDVRTGSHNVVVGRHDNFSSGATKIDSGARAACGGKRPMTATPLTTAAWPNGRTSETRRHRDDQPETILAGCWRCVCRCRAGDDPGRAGLP
jgi:hypothetical protein